jgi:hypothetical protein
LKPTKIFIYIITAICLIYEIIGIIAPGIDTLSPVIQYFFFKYPFTVVCTFYLMGHFVIKHPKTFHIAISLGVLASLVALSQIIAIWLYIAPIFWMIVSFIMGAVFWSQGGDFWIFRRKS